MGKKKLTTKDINALLEEARPLLDMLRIRSADEGSRSRTYNERIDRTLRLLKKAQESMGEAARALALLRLDELHASAVNLCHAPETPHVDAVNGLSELLSKTQHRSEWLGTLIELHTFRRKEMKNKKRTAPPKYLDETLEIIRFYEERTGQKVRFPTARRQPKENKNVGVGSQSEMKKSVARRKINLKNIHQPSVFFVSACLQIFQPSIDAGQANTLIRNALEHQRELGRLVEEILARDI